MPRFALTPGAILALVAVGLLGLSWLKRRATNPAASLLDPLNPLSSENLAHQLATGAVQAVTGDKNAAPGPTLYDVTHPGEDAAAGKSAPSVLWMISPVGAVYYWAERARAAAAAPKASPTYADLDDAARRLEDVSPFAVGA